MFSCDKHGSSGSGDRCHLCVTEEKYGIQKKTSPWEKLVERFHDRDKQEKPYGWIQWKGTDACIDVNCICGALTHIDADFTYLIQCGECKRVYWPTAFIKLVELTGDDLKLANDCNDGDGHHFVVSK